VGRQPEPASRGESSAYGDSPLVSADLAETLRGFLEDIDIVVTSCPVATPNLVVTLRFFQLVDGILAVSRHLFDSLSAEYVSEHLSEVSSHGTFPSVEIKLQTNLMGKAHPAVSAKSQAA
jgi:hypothetical protein